MWLFIKNLLFTVAIPGTVAASVPFFFLTRDAELWGVLWMLAGVTFLIIGGSIYLWCVRTRTFWDRAPPGFIDPAGATLSDSDTRSGRSTWKDPALGYRSNQGEILNRAPPRQHASSSRCT